MPYEKICEKCGAKYRITEHHYPMRDKDSIKCKYCDTELLSWNDGCFYSEDEIQGPTVDKYKGLINIETEDDID